MKRVQKMIHGQLVWVTMVPPEENAPTHRRNCSELGMTADRSLYRARVRWLAKANAVRKDRPWARS